jgi:hypothetical protein
MEGAPGERFRTAIFAGSGDKGLLTLARYEGRCAMLGIRAPAKKGARPQGARAGSGACRAGIWVN